MSANPRFRYFSNKIHEKMTCIFKVITRVSFWWNHDVFSKRMLKPFVESVDKKKKNTTGFLCQLKSGIFFSSSLIIQVTWTNEEIMIYLREDFNRNRLTLLKFVFGCILFPGCMFSFESRKTNLGNGEKMSSAISWRSQQAVYFI